MDKTEVEVSRDIGTCDLLIDRMGKEMSQAAAGASWTAVLPLLADMEQVIRKHQDVLKELVGYGKITVNYDVDDGY
jgi:hypothetical protein